MLRQIFFFVAFVALTQTANAGNTDKVDVSTHKNTVNIEIECAFKGFVELQFTDGSGQLIYAEIVYKSEETLSHKISTRYFVQGNYQLQIVTAKPIFETRISVSCSKNKWLF